MIGVPRQKTVSRRNEIDLCETESIGGPTRGTGLTINSSGVLAMCDTVNTVLRQISRRTTPFLFFPLLLFFPPYASK